MNKKILEKLNPTDYLRHKASNEVTNEAALLKFSHRCGFVHFAACFWPVIRLRLEEGKKKKAWESSQKILNFFSALESRATCCGIENTSEPLPIFLFPYFQENMNVESKLSDLLEENFVTKYLSSAWLHKDVPSLTPSRTTTYWLQLSNWGVLTWLRCSSPIQKISICRLKHS